MYSHNTYVVYSPILYIFLFKNVVLWIPLAFISFEFWHLLWEGKYTEIAFLLLIILVNR